MLIFLALLERSEDEPAFIAMYNEFKPTLTGVGMSLCGNIWIVEDALQMTWMEVAKNFVKISAIPCHKTASYLATIMRNNCKDLLRKEKKYTGIDEDMANDDVFENIHDNDAVDNIGNLINRLPDIYREVLEHRLILGEKNKHIADYLRISEPLVAKRYERGRAMLIELLKKEEYSHHA